MKKKQKQTFSSQPADKNKTKHENRRKEEKRNKNQRQAKGKKEYKRYETIAISYTRKDIIIKKREKKTVKAWT